MGLNLKAPDHTTLSRRNQIVAVPPLTRSYDGPIDLIVDSTGLKILGCGSNPFFRYKSVLGGGLKARQGKAQRREVAIGCHILNRMAELGRPKSCAVVS